MFTSSTWSFGRDRARVSALARDFWLGATAGFSRTGPQTRVFGQYGINLLGLGRQAAALVVVEPGLLAQLFFEDPELLLELFHYLLLVTVGPTGQAEEQNLKLVHGQSMQ